MTHTLRAMTWNIHKCIGADRKFDPGRIVSVLRVLDADVTALQEADERFGRRRGLLNLEMLSESGIRSVPVTASSVTGNGRYRDSHGWCGNVILVSRHMDVRSCDKVVLPGVETRGALVSDMTHTPTGRDIRVIACHLGLMRLCRKQQVALLLEWVEDAPGEVLFLGDTNEWRRDMSRRSSLHALCSAGMKGHRHETFPSKRPLLGLDRILSSSPACPASFVPSVPGLPDASDHLPLLADL